MRKDVKSVSYYVELYDMVQEKSPSEEVAIAIMQEIGKDKRTEDIAEISDNGGATEKQKQFMKDLGIDFPEDISRKEASALIDEKKSKA